MGMEKDAIVRELLSLRGKELSHAPDIRSIPELVDATLFALFPQLSHGERVDSATLTTTLEQIEHLLRGLCVPVLNSDEQVGKVVEGFMRDLPRFHSALMEDARAIYHGDPAAANLDEVILAYPGFFAISVYRLAHFLYEKGVPVIPRMLSEYAHRMTGIDIHPGATIGSAFVIDHGTGVVIGETAVIEENVKIYQGVTLGALSVQKTLANKKRHPTIGRDVVIYANATILGGSTIVGAGSIIGGNVWITESVPPGSRVYHRP
jgi:serine O-acetyltransferase